MSRRLRRQYLDIIRGDGANWYFPWGWAGNGAGKVPFGNAWAAFFFAKQWGGRDGVDVHRLQSIVCRAQNPEAAYRWAREMPGANVRRLQKVVTSYGSLELIRAFAQNVRGADRKFLEGLCIVKEVLGT